MKRLYFGINYYKLSVSTSEQFSLISMGRSSYRVFDDRYPYFVTFSVQSRFNILNGRIAQLILESFEYLKSKNEAEIYAYVIMPDHVHMIIKAKFLPKVMRRLKSYTARRIIDHLKETNQQSILMILQGAKLHGNSSSNYQLWQVGYHPKQISSYDMFKQKVNYIHHNPVSAKLVESPGDWKYSSYHKFYSQSRAL